MPPLDFPEFHQSLQSADGTTSSIAVLLAWLMAADEEVAGREELYLNSFLLSESISPSLSKEIREIGLTAPVKELAAAVKHLGRNVSQEQHMLVLDLLLGMILCDGKIHAGEKLVLELVADTFQLSNDMFRERYKELSGRDYTSPPDFSSARWWADQRNNRESTNKNEDQQGERSAGNGSGDSAYSSTSDKPMTSTRAFAILGLEMGAEEDEIRTAYRTLAQVHHPDRFAKLGNEAQVAAQHTFVRIKEAYDFLRPQ